MLLLIDWNWAGSARQLGQILAAFILTLPIAWNREQADRGTATAVSIWNAGAIGAAVALGRFEIAVLLALADYLILRFLSKLNMKIKRDGVLR